jgi:adenosylcobinamide kinase/adenosylcobinamide-phosphate guanylyltransferase
MPDDQPVCYVATGRRIFQDAEWTERIAAHQARRPPSWRTVETLDLADELARPPAAPVLVDDLATWLTGTLDELDGWSGGSEGRVAGRVDRLVAAVAGFTGRLVLVSAEVGLGVVPASPSGRLFRDELGALNARMAAVCDEVLLLVAGLPLRLK